MKRFLVGLFLVAGVCYGANVPGIKHDWQCQKGNVKITYRVSYKNVDGQAPCKVYELYAGQKTKKIADSVKTDRVCEDVINAVIAKLEGQGMTCVKIAAPAGDTNQEQQK